MDSSLPALPAPPAPEHFAAPVGPRPGERGVVGAAQARDHAPGPRWYRLPEESWAMIRAEYLAGATAKQLAVKWGVSPTSVYRHACQDGFTKARRGEAINLEAVTRFAAQAAAAEARAAQAARDEVEAQAEAARRTREVEAEADPAEAARTLLRRAAGAALAGRLEGAMSLLKLAEGFGRSAAARPSGGDGRRAEPPAWEDPFEALPPYHPDALFARPAAVQRADAEAQQAKASRLRLELETRLAEVFAREAETRARAAERREAQGGA